MHRIGFFLEAVFATLSEGFGLLIGLGLFSAVLTWIVSSIVKLPFTPAMAGLAVAIVLFIYFLGAYYGQHQRTQHELQDQSKKSGS